MQHMWVIVRTSVFGQNGWIVAQKCFARSRTQRTQSRLITSSTPSPQPIKGKKQRIYYQTLYRTPWQSQTGKAAHFAAPSYPFGSTVQASIQFILPTCRTSQIFTSLTPLEILPCPIVLKDRWEVLFLKCDLVDSIPFLPQQGVFIFSLVTYSPLKYDGYEYPGWGQAIGWIMALSSIACIPAVMIYKFATTPGSLQEVTQMKYFVIVQQRQITKPFSK